MRLSLGHFLAFRGVQLIALLCAAIVHVVTGNAATVTASTTVNCVPIDRVEERPPAENEFPTTGHSRFVTNFATAK
jgi:hypothetical protein